MKKIIMMSCAVILASGMTSAFAKANKQSCHVDIQQMKQEIHKDFNIMISIQNGLKAPVDNVFFMSAKHNKCKARCYVMAPLSKYINCHWQSGNWGDTIKGKL